MVTLGVTAHLLGKTARIHHEYASSALGCSHRTQFAHHGDQDALHAPVLALLQIAFLSDDCEEVNTGLGYARGAMLDGKHLAPEKSRHKVVEFAAGKFLQQRAALLRRHPGVIALVTITGQTDHAEIVMKAAGSNTCPASASPCTADSATPWRGNGVALIVSTCSVAHEPATAIRPLHHGRCAAISTI